MSSLLSLSDGTYLVRLARKAIERQLKAGEQISPDSEEGILGEARGVFVTLEEFPSRELRGCIGYPLPVKPLAQSVIDNALHAAFEDPRFGPVKQEELSKLVIEISVLTVPAEIKVKRPTEYLDKIKVGEDGLIVRYGFSSGLLLPQVAPEQGWNSKEFLSHTCAKAGLPSDMWMSASISVSKFQAQIFSEQSPGGEVVEKNLKK